MIPNPKRVLANLFGRNFGPKTPLQYLDFTAGELFSRTEGIIPAPEATHAIAQIVREAQRCKEEGKSETLLFNLCGHGYFDMAAYANYFDGNLVEHETTKDEIDASLAQLSTPTID